MTFSNEAYADDTLAVARTRETMLKMVDMLEVFENVSGVQVNAEKSAATKLFILPNGRSTPSSSMVSARTRFRD